MHGQNTHYIFKKKLMWSRSRHFMYVTLPMPLLDTNTESQTRMKKPSSRLATATSYVFNHLTVLEPDCQHMNPTFYHEVTILTRFKLCICIGLLVFNFGIVHLPFSFHSSFDLSCIYSAAESQKAMAMKTKMSFTEWQVHP